MHGQIMLIRGACYECTLKGHVLVMCGNNTTHHWRIQAFFCGSFISLVTKCDYHMNKYPAVKVVINISQN